MSTILRLTVATVCLLGVIGLGVHYGTTYGDRGPYPTAEQLDEYGGIDDEEIFVVGEVIEIDDDGMTVRIEEGEATIVVTVDRVPPDVEPGGVVQVTGTFEDERSIAATDVVVVNEDRSDERYKLGVSVVGVLVAAGYFLWYWRPTRSGWEVRTRG